MKEDVRRIKGDEKSSKLRKKLKGLKSPSHSTYFLIPVETTKVAHNENKDSQEIDQTAPVVVEKNNDQKKDNDQDNAAIGTTIVKGPKMSNKKTAIQGPKTESRKNTTETVKNGTTRTEATKTIRSQSSIRKNTRRTDPDQKREITQMKDETEIKTMNLNQA